MNVKVPELLVLSAGGVCVRLTTGVLTGMQIAIAANRRAHYWCEQMILPYRSLNMRCESLSGHGSSAGRR